MREYLDEHEISDLQQQAPNRFNFHGFRKSVGKAEAKACVMP